MAILGRRGHESHGLVRPESVVWPGYAQIVPVGAHILRMDHPESEANPLTPLLPTPSTGVSLEHGLASHRRMFEIAETDTDAAITYALDGARIFQALRQQNPIQPEWVAVHE